jgi:acetylornithine deacetylase/succinyl-diaminopimelate desuccinylase-like protein
VASTPSATTDAFLAELSELLRIESVSSDGVHPAELRAAADWIAALIGGDAAVTTDHGNPLVDGTIPASTPGAPTVIAYGHYDVQAVGPLELWDSPPFEPTIRDGWLHCRGITDDKGNFYAVLRAALDLASAGELGVNVRVFADGEEEIGGHSVIHHLNGVEGDFAAAVIFDGGMVDARRPAITTGLRGLVGAQLRLRTGRRELHSGMYGGAAANAVHELNAVLARLIDLPAEFSEGIAPVTSEERADWAALPAGPDVLRDAGALPLDAGAGSEFYERTGARPSLTVHSIAAGDPTLHKTSIVQEALASVSLRLAPGQDAEAMSERFDHLLRGSVRDGVTLDVEMWPPAQPAWMDPHHPVLRAGFDAIEVATGARPLAVRSGGTIPVGAAFTARGIPTILSGFGTDDDNIHSPNERMELRRLDWAYASAREIFRALPDTV